MFNKTDTGLNLGTHASRRKLALSEILLRLFQAERPKTLLLLFPKIEIDLINLSKDHKKISIHRLCQLFSGQILIDHGFDAPDMALVVQDYGYPPLPLRQSR